MKRKNGKSQATIAQFAVVAKAFVSCATSALGTSQASSLFIVAAQQWLEAGDMIQAAKAFEAGGDTEQATIYFAKRQFFDDAVRNARDQRTSQPTRDAVFRSAKLFYFRNGELKKARSLFPSDNSALEFLEDRGFNGMRFYLTILRNNVAHSLFFHQWLEETS